MNTQGGVPRGAGLTPGYILQPLQGQGKTLTLGTHLPDDPVSFVRASRYRLGKPFSVAKITFACKMQLTQTEG